MDNEIWKDVPGYKGYYQASTLGNVKSLDRCVKGAIGEKLMKGKILSKTLHASGYYVIGLSKNGLAKTYLLHKIIAIVFLNYSGNNRKIVVDHKNNVKTDNRVCNLQIISQRLNSSKDKFRSSPSSKYSGVCWHKNLKKWHSSIRINGKRKHLGYFIDEYKAHLAYRKALENL